MKPFNIFDATGEHATGWSKTDKLKETAISGLLDKAAKQANSLNAIPSPFSRLHIFETAFKLVVKDINDNKDRASHVYKELVSDCLDALELVFNWQYHISQGSDLSVENWHPDNLQNLPKGSSGSRTYAKTLDLFLSQDFATDFQGFSIIKYKGMVVCGSSPISLMFTSANLDKVKGEFVTQRYSDSFDLINPISNSVYFKKVRSFGDRSDAFKAYMLDFFNSNSSLKRSANGVWTYLKSQGIEEIPRQNSLQLKPVASQNGGTFSINNVQFLSNNDPGAADIFYDHIIKTNYRIDDTRFITPKYVDDDPERDFDFLLPIKESFLSNLKLSNLSNLFSYEITGPNSIKVIFKGDQQTTSKSREYTVSRSDKRDGQIVNIQTDYSLNFMIAIFPFLRIKNSDGSDSAKNNYYKVLYGIDAQFADYSSLNTSSFSLQFYKKGDNGLEQIGSDGAIYNAKRDERRRFENNDNIASVYYGLSNTSFDLIKVKFPSSYELQNVNGMIIPKWTEKVIGNKEFSYSVDFGTTNTFIAYTDDTERKSTPIPFDIKTSDAQMVMLHKPKKQVGGNSIDSTFDNVNLSSLKDSLLNHEFVPPVLLNETDSQFKMPFRTAVFQKRNISTYDLFSDLNIHFAYQKAHVDANSNMTQEIVPNIKWDITNSDDKGAKARVEAFIKELCLIIKFKTILNGGDPAKTQINWFIPQSLSYAAREAYKKIWNTYSKDILGTTRSTNMVFESEAPYYFLKKKAEIKNPTSVLSLDIGGGSTDAMLFVNDLPRIGTSFNFAGNILWSNGHIQLTNDAKENGIYLGIKDAMSTKVQTIQDPSIRNNSIYFTKMSSDEIINFWLSNNDKLDVIHELSNPSFKILYLIHFSALIYHTAQWLRLKNHTAPTCIIFSGNGSKYIDLLGDQELLSKISGFIISKVYKSNESHPQIILPAANRKEATCFGGIFKEQNVSFTPETYLGTEINFPNLDNIQKYRDVQDNFTEIKSSVNRNVNELFKILQDLNNFIPFKSHLNIDINLPALLSYVSSRVESNFILGYDIRKQKVDHDEEITDSLFFYPLIGIIFEVGKLTKENIDDHIPKILKYTPGPNGDNTFSLKAASDEATINSNYVISISSSNRDEATYELINNPTIHQRVYSSFDSLIKPVCFCEKFPDNLDNIVAKTVTKGQLKRDGDQWIVTERLKLVFE